MQLFKIILALLMLVVIVGYIRPWWMLWWHEAPNRLRILKYYGLPLIFLLALYLFTN